MKRILLIIFTVFCVAVCAVPSVGMIFRPTDKPIGNERQSAAPTVTNKDGSFNFSYFTQLGGYYEKHFAFRPEMIQADAMIQSKGFFTSNINTVLVGNNDWLYYTSSTDDYLGKNTLSDKEINGVVNNLKLIQRYSESNGAHFLFTVAPNKNTLYPDNMPYTYSAKVSDTHNRDLLHSALKDSGVNYCNLFEPLSEQSETLYFARDSHWNNEGARIAVNAVLEAADIPLDLFGEPLTAMTHDFRGDLDSLLYPKMPRYDDEYVLDLGDRFRYLSGGSGPMNLDILTQYGSDKGLGMGRSLVFRDSFGSALIPYFAACSGSARFHRALPYRIDLLEDAQGGMTIDTDLVVVEIAERNLRNLIGSDARIAG